MSKLGLPARYKPFVTRMDLNATRLPACDRWHPESPGELRVIHDDTGKPLQRECRMCKRLRAQAQYVRGYSRARLPVKKAYGIVRLSWIPPERLIT